MWAPTLEELSKLAPQREVLALDLPGHGDSPRRDTYRSPRSSSRFTTPSPPRAWLHLRSSGTRFAGVLATFYAARYPTAHVVNVDQTLFVKPFAEAMLNAMAHGAGYRSSGRSTSPRWESRRFPPPAQRLLESTSTPRLDLLAGYWGELAEQAPDNLQERIDENARRVASPSSPLHHRHRKRPRSRIRSMAPAHAAGRGDRRVRVGRPPSAPGGPAAIRRGARSDIDGCRSDSRTSLRVGRGNPPGGHFSTTNATPRGPIGARFCRVPAQQRLRTTIGAETAPS